MVLSAYWVYRLEKNSGDHIVIAQIAMTEK
jgi:hypothetical protein